MPTHDTVFHVDPRPEPLPFEALPAIAAALSREAEYEERLSLNSKDADARRGLDQARADVESLRERFSLERFAPAMQYRDELIKRAADASLFLVAVWLYEHGMVNDMHDRHGVTATVAKARPAFANPSAVAAWIGDLIERRMLPAEQKYKDAAQMQTPPDNGR